MSRPAKQRQRVVLSEFRYARTRELLRTEPEQVDQAPYAFARFGPRFGRFWDLSQDGDSDQLARLELAIFQTPEQLAAWLELPLGKVAWLTGLFSETRRPETERDAHYFHRWVRKRSGGWRLIEAPKPLLKAVQTRINQQLACTIPPHEAVHGFVPGHSIISNAQPHVGQRVVVKFDLENFYATVSFSRIVAIFRRVGYSREAAIWLGRLTTSVVPWSLASPEGDAEALRPYATRHLPQGAPTSPALANLSAFGLDIRLAGLARSFHANYTRYADDLTFSGPDRFLRSLHVFIPLVTQIVAAERFRVNRAKRKILRNNQRQTVTGVVVNERVNVTRRDFDRLKAILVNCVRFGPSSQNRHDVPDFAAHLRGRIAHIMQLNPARGIKLLGLYHQIRW